MWARALAWSGSSSRYAPFSCHAHGVPALHCCGLGHSWWGHLPSLAHPVSAPHMVNAANAMRLQHAELHQGTEDVSGNAHCSTQPDYSRGMCGAKRSHWLASCMRDLFVQMARSKKACLVFFDEIDAIGGARFDDGAGAHLTHSRMSLRLDPELC